MSKTIIVTGGSKGLGLECVRTLLQTFQSNVVVLSRSISSELSDLKAKHESQLSHVQGDVAEELDQKKAVEHAITKFGSLEGLILNAGTLDPVSSIANADIASFKKAFDVNFFSLVSILQVALPHLRTTNGKVVFTSSGAATGNYTAWGAYNASKAAMNSLCRTVAAEEPDVTFVAIRPGVLETAMQDEVLSKGKDHMSPADYKRFVDIKEQGKRVPPAKPGYVLASLAVKADPQLSGQFLNWSDDVLSSHQRDV